MPIIKMPDGQNVRFPDDMPNDEIRSLIQQKYPDSVESLSKPSVAGAAEQKFPQPNQPQQEVDAVNAALGVGVAPDPAVAAAYSESAKTSAYKKAGLLDGTTIAPFDPSKESVHQFLARKESEARTAKEKFDEQSAVAKAAKQAADVEAGEHLTRALEGRETEDDKVVDALNKAAQLRSVLAKRPDDSWNPLYVADALLATGPSSGFFGAIGGAIRGNDTSKPDGLIDKAAQYFIDYQNDYRKTLEERRVNQTVGSAGQSVGYSLATMAPMAAGPAGWGVGGAMMFRGQQNQFMQQAREAYESEHGKLSDVDWDKKAELIKNESAISGAFEAIPELVSDRIFFGVVGNILGAKTLSAALKRAVVGEAINFGNESGSEMVTQIGQNVQQHDANKILGIAQNEPRPDYKNPADWVEAYTQVAPAVAIQSAMMIGGGSLYANARKHEEALANKRLLDDADARAKMDLAAAKANEQATSDGVAKTFAAQDVDGAAKAAMETAARNPITGKDVARAHDELTAQAGSAAAREDLLSRVYEATGGMDVQTAQPQGAVAGEPDLGAPAGQDGVREQLPDGGEAAAAGIQPVAVGDGLAAGGQGHGGGSSGVFSRAATERVNNDVGGQNAESQKAIETLQSSLDKYGYDATVSLAVPDDTAQGRNADAASASHKIAESLADLFDSKLVLFKQIGGKFEFNGVKLGKNIYLRADSDKPAHVVYGHELLHELRATSEDAYQSFIAQLRPLMTDIAGYREESRIGNEMHEDGVIEELAADIVGNRFYESSFWKMLSLGAPEHFNTIANTVLKMLDKIRAVFGERGKLKGDRFLLDVNKARVVVAEAIIAHKKSQLRNTESGIKFSPAKNERASQAEQRFSDMVENNSDELIRRYIDKNGRIVDADKVKELSPDYMADKKLAYAVHEPSSKLSKMIFTKMLKDDPTAPVIFTAGGGGSGKSEAMPVALASIGVNESNSIVFDSTLAGYDSAVKKIREALEGGRKVAIVYTNAPVLKAGMFAMSRERIVPLRVLARAHVDASNTIRKIANEFAGNDNLSISVVNNFGKISDIKVGTLDDVFDYEYNQVERSLYEQATEQRSRGVLGEESFNTFVAGSEAADGKGGGRAGEEAPGQESGGGSAGGRTPSFSRVEKGEAGGFSYTQFKDGSLQVNGDIANIRETLPNGYLGQPKGDGLMFSHTDAHVVLGALSGDRNAYSRAGKVIEKLPMKDGKYIGAPEKFDTPGKIGTLRKWLRKLTDEGAPGRFWYENSSKEVLQMVGGDVNEARKFVALLAIYSPQAKVDTNSTFALRAWAQYKAGQPISVKTGVKDKKAQAALDDIDEFWSGEKTGNFFNNLLREIDPKTAGKQGTTIDMWMMRAAQYGTDTPTATQYAFMENETNRIAAEMGWEPQQVQAAIWVAVKARMENKGVKEATEGKSAKKGWISYNESGVRVIHDAKAHRDNWLKHAFEHDPTTHDTQAAKFDFSDGVRRHIGQVSFEARPGRTAGILPGIHEADYAKQVEYQQAFLNALYDSEGNDLIAMRLGLLEDSEVTAPGVWQGEVSPSVQKNIAMAPGKGEAGKGVDPAQAKTLDAYAAILGLLGKQEGVGWHRPFYKGTRSSENGAEIGIGRVATPEEVRAAYDAVSSLMKSKGKSADSLGFISSPKGLRIVNFGEITNTELQKEVVPAAAEAMPDSHVVYFSTDGNLVGNNWKESKDGQDFISTISGAGRSDLLGWVRDVLAPRVQRVNEDFSQKYGWGDPGELKFSRKDESRAGDEQRLRVSSEQVTAEQGEATHGSVGVIGLHYSNDRRNTLTGAHYGRGMKGAESQRVAGDPVLSKRIHFYVDEGNGVAPESGVGGHAHAIKLNNLYNVNEDPMGIVARSNGANETERAIVDAGYDGVYVPGAQGKQGVAVLIGDHSVQPSYIGPHSVPAAGMHAPESTVMKRGLMSAEISRFEDGGIPGAPSAHLKSGTLVYDKKDMAAVDKWLGKAEEQTTAEPAFSRKAKQPFYSQLERGIEAASDKVFTTGKQVKAWIDANAGKMHIKKDEVYWTGLSDWLETQGKVTKDQVLAFVRENGVQVKDVMLRDAAVDRGMVSRFARYGLDIKWDSAADEFEIRDRKGNYIPDRELPMELKTEVRLATEERLEAGTEGDTEYSKWQLPGGKNYRELLLTLPSKKTSLTFEQWTSQKFTGEDTPNARRMYAEQVDESDPNFHAPHFKEYTNILAHIRFNERTDADGKRVLFLEEIQSDAQQGARAGKNIPEMPFTNTSDPKPFVALALKRMIAYAVDNGFEKISWTNGDQQSARYDLSKQVKKVVAMTADGGKTFNIRGTDLSDNGHDFGTFPVEKLDGVVGKYLAAKIAEQKIPNEVYAGNNLKIGGSGMRTFYDQIVPSVANEILRKSGGGKVTDVRMNLGGEMEATKFKDFADYTANKNKDVVQPGFDITPELRNKVNVEGLPLFSRKQSSAPEETKTQAGARLIQDKMNRFAVVRDWLETQGKKLTEAADVWMHEGNMHGKIATRSEDFRELVVKPLIEKTQKAGFSLAQVAEYLEMRHIPEANARMRNIHNDDTATANGVTDDEAIETLRKYEELPNFKQLEQIASEWRGITDSTKQILIESGIISQDLADAWQATYENYVPLKGDESADGTGKGMSVNGKTKRRLGHGEREEAVIENILRDHERAIGLSEKNAVGLALIEMGLEVNDPSIMTIDRPAKRQVYRPGQSHYVVTYHGSDVEVFDNINDARRFADTEALRPGRNKSDFAIRKTSDADMVVLMASPMLADNEVNVYIQGQAVRVQLNDELLAQAYTNMGVEHIGKFMEALRGFNRWLSIAYTGYNPEFVLKNLTRDAIAGAINLSGDYGVGMTAKIYANYPAALKELSKSIRDPRKSKIVTEYRAAGGSTGAAYLSDIERIKGDVMDAYNEYAGGINTYRRVYDAEIAAGRSSKYAAMKASAKAGKAIAGRIPIVGHMLRLIEHVNAVTENALRLATYMTLKENGYSTAKAAQAAKMSTVNFNRKGELTNQASALWLFFNPNVQGTQRMFNVLTQGKHKHQAQALVGSMVVGAYLMSQMFRAGDDDDKWKNTPAYVRDRNIVIPAGSKQVTIPVPYGYGFFWAMGNAMSDLQNGAPKGKIASRLADSFFDNFSPMGDPMQQGEVTLLQIMPTVVKMLTGPEMNKDSFGRDLMPKKTNDAQPDSQVMYRNTKATAYAKIAEKMNEYTGGNKYHAGLVDVSPETLKYWVNSLTGGAGKFVVDSISLGQLAAYGIEPDMKEVPIVRGFVREPGHADTKQKFYEEMKQAKQYADEFALAKKAHDGMGIHQIIDDNKPEIALAKMAEHMQKALAHQSDLIDDIRQNDKLSLAEKRLQEKAIEREQDILYKRFMKAFEEKERSK